MKVSMQPASQMFEQFDHTLGKYTYQLEFCTFHSEEIHTVISICNGSSFLVMSKLTSDGKLQFSAFLYSKHCMAISNVNITRIIILSE